MVFQVTFIEKDSGDRVKIVIDPESRISDTVKKLQEYWDFEDEISLYRDGKTLDVDLTWSEMGLDDDATIKVFPRKSSNKLPKETWMKRVNNEIEFLKDRGCISDIQRENKEVVVEVELTDTPGPVRLDDSIGCSFKHRFDIHFYRDYPYSSPDVIWRTKVFHPNIESGEKDGRVSFYYLKDWSFDKNAVELMENIEELLLSPDLKNKIESKGCSEAAQRYMQGEFPEK
ncbi:MAG: ubiquitin-conjugating enzyme E2 [Thermoplasmata archaeon]